MRHDRLHRTAILIRRFRIDDPRVLLLRQPGDPQAKLTPMRVHTRPLSPQPHPCDTFCSYASLQKILLSHGG